MLSRPKFIYYWIAISLLGNVMFSMSLLHAMTQKNQRYNELDIMFICTTGEMKAISLSTYLETGKLVFIDFDGYQSKINHSQTCQTCLAVDTSNKAISQKSYLSIAPQNSHSRLQIANTELTSFAVTYRLNARAPPSS